MKAKPFLVAAFSLVSLSSCSFHYGTSSAGSAMITNENFKIDFAYGSTKSTKIFGIGAFNREGLVLDAKKNLYKNYPLQPGQALGNMTVDFKTTFVLFVSTTKVTISAELINFSKNAQNYEQTKQNINEFIQLSDDGLAMKTNQINSGTSSFKIGDQVVYEKDSETNYFVVGAENDLLIIESVEGLKQKVSPSNVKLK